MVCEAGICIALSVANKETTGDTASGSGKKNKKKKGKSTAAGSGADESEDTGESEEMYGVLTPSTALGTPFLRRLQDSPGITFPIE